MRLGTDAGSEAFVIRLFRISGPGTKRKIDYACSIDNSCANGRRISSRLPGLET
jgi:hypothetical protein